MNSKKNLDRESKDLFVNSEMSKWLKSNIGVLNKAFNKASINKMFNAFPIEIKINAIHL